MKVGKDLLFHGLATMHQVPEILVVTMYALALTGEGGSILHASHPVLLDSNHFLQCHIVQHPLLHIVRGICPGKAQENNICGPHEANPRDGHISPLSFFCLMFICSC